jgi:hypothetical protein
MSKNEQRAATVRGAKRVLTDAKRNRDYAYDADLPTWVRAACQQRVEAARRRLAELRHAELTAQGNPMAGLIAAWDAEADRVTDRTGR